MSIHQSTNRTYPLANNLEADHWLDEAMKSQPLYFAKPSDKDLEPNSPINLSRFGLHNATQVKAFLTSSAGETLKTEIKVQAAIDDAIEEQHMFELREQEKLNHRLRAHLLLWFIEKKGHAASHLRELIEELNTKAINQSKPDAKENKASKEPSKANAELLRHTLNSYNAEIKKCEEQHQLASAEESKLTEEFENLHKQKVRLDNKHDLFMDKMAAFHEQIETYEQLSNEELDAQMAEMETKLHSLTDTISDLLASGEPGSEEEAYALLDQQNALNLDIAQLIDIRSSREKQKAFYDANGTEVPSAKDASFIVGKDKQIIKHDDNYYFADINSKIAERNGTHYLIDKEANIDEMTPEELEQAQEQLELAAAHFHKSEHEISTVNKAVTKTLKMEKEFHDLDKRMDDVAAKTQEKRDEKMNLENKKNLLQSVRASFIQQNPGLEQDTAPKPSPTLSGKAQPASMPTPAPQAVIKITQTLIPFLSLRRSPKDISNEIDKNKDLNPKEKGQAKDYFSRLIKLLSLGKIPSLAPLPETTMQSLLQHMSRFGALQAKPGVSTEKGPLDKQQDVKMSPPLDGPHAKVGPKPPTPKPVNNPEQEPEMKPFNPSPFKTHGYS
ncbi:hypothetical protein ACD661_06065 [Legionella lytica]|uniref:LidA long coiled-coil domain-containing protein n=1 Tax=Legionella lytica TaxID=96232 RepID=A0ABW8D5Z8_9GAMM